jgi:hypothetical protein
MKPIHYILYVTAAALVLLEGCNDAGLVGPSIQPEGDKSIIRADTFALRAATVELDSVYAKSYNGLLGEFTDPMFGTLKSDYFCEFYSQDGFAFRHAPIDGKIDSMFVVLFYERGKWIGDSLSPMEATVYPLSKPLEGNFYTNYDPSGHADVNTPLGRITYTPRDHTVSDSIWNLSTDATEYHNTHLRIRLPQSLGQSFYDETINNPSTFANRASFNRFFPGLYVTNTFGSGNILVVTDTRMLIFYRYITPSSTGADSIVSTAEAFYVTEDVIQLNRFRNTGISHLLDPSDEFTYLKTPAGVYTRITIPTKEIFATIRDRGRKINGANFTLSAMPQQDWTYALATPSYLLLLPEDSLLNFFRDNKIDNSVTSYASAIRSTSTSTTYSFGSIANMLSHYIETQPDLEELNLLVVPIERTLVTGSDGMPTNVSSAIGNYLRPSTLQLRKDTGMMRIAVLTNNRDN